MRRTYLYFIVLFFILSSCSREFHYDLDYSKKIVVFCVLKADSFPVMNVFYAQPIDDYSVDSVFTTPEAYVEIRDDSNNKYILLPDSTDPWGIVYYRNKELRPREGRTYYLKVYVPGYDTVRGQTRIPTRPNVDTVIYNCKEIDTVEINGVMQRRVIYNVTLKFRELNSTGYYFLMSYDKYFDYLGSYAYIPGPGIWSTDSKTLNAGSILGILFKGITDTDNSLQYNFNVSVSNPYVTDVYLYSSYDDLYRFYKVESEQAPSEPHVLDAFREPAIDYSNVENGLGIFTSLSRPYVIHFEYKK